MGIAKPCRPTHPDRISQLTPPAWYITNHTYGTNTAPLTNPEGMIYPASSLMYTTTTDPDSKSTDVYTDKIGRAVLQRRETPPIPQIPGQYMMIRADR
ncbi:MAG: hypothetical protein IPJ13_32015 [Saprospiraceae bacterium]|nr:hypothetical protein [Saprospiraceae bacterium]